MHNQVAVSMGEIAAMLAEDAKHDHDAAHAPTEQQVSVDLGPAQLIHAIEQKRAELRRLRHQTERVKADLEELVEKANEVMARVAEDLKHISQELRDE